MNRIKTPWQSWLSLALGDWLLASPIIGIGADTGVAAWNAHFTGTVVVILSAWALLGSHRYQGWVNAALASWILVSPFALHFVSDLAALWNHLAVGILMGADVLWALSVRVVPHRALSVGHPDSIQAA